MNDFLSRTGIVISDWASTIRITAGGRDYEGVVSPDGWVPCLNRPDWEEQTIVIVAESGDSRTTTMYRTQKTGTGIFIPYKLEPGSKFTPRWAWGA
jgi:hypothetical protein